MTDYYLKKILLSCLFLSIQFISNYSYCQEVCPVTFGDDIAKPNDEWICLNGSSLWFSEDEVCWHKEYFPELDQPDHGYPRTIDFFNETDGIIATQDNPNFGNSKIFITKDGGHTWENQPYTIEDGCQNGLASFQLFVLDENTVLLTQYFFIGKFLLSKDRGVTWSCIDRYNLEQGQIPDIEIIDKNTWYVPTNDGVIKTNDQGETHNLVVPGDFYFLEKNSDKNQLYAIGRDELGYIFYWIENESIVESVYLEELIPDIGYIYQFVVANDIFYLFSASRLYVSMDTGVSWELMDTGDIEDIGNYGLSVHRVQNEVFTSRSRLLKLNCTNTDICDMTEISDDIFAYPNPTDKYVTFNTVQFDRVHIYDSNAKLIESRTFEKGLNFQRLRINIENLQSGVYIFVLENDDSTLSKKVLKL